MSRRPVAAAAAAISLVLIAGAAWLAVDDDRSLDGVLEDLGLRSSEAGLEGSGTLEGRVAAIGAELGGTVVAVPRTPGDIVERGDVLAELADPALAARARQAEAAVEVALATRQRVASGATPEQIRVAEAELAKAQAAADGAERAWRAARERRRAAETDPSVERAALLSARAAEASSGSAYEVAAALRDAAAAGLALTRAGPSEHDLAVAEAGVRQARAAADVLSVQEERLTVRAPWGGTVDEVLVTEGETVAPGSTVLRLATLEPLSITIYLTEKDLAEIGLQTAAEVRVDAWGDRVFEGSVAAIASEPEFAPQAAQTAEERADLVYAVTVRVPNEGGTLSAGMPANVRLVPDET